MQRFPIENLISSHTGGTVKCTCERAPLYAVNFLYGGGGGGGTKKISSAHPLKMTGKKGLLLPTII